MTVIPSSALHTLQSPHSGGCLAHWVPRQLPSALIASLPVGEGRLPAFEVR